MTKKGKTKANKLIWQSDESTGDLNDETFKPLRRLLDEEGKMHHEFRQNCYRMRTLVSKSLKYALLRVERLRKHLTQYVRTCELCSGNPNEVEVEKLKERISNENKKINEFREKIKELNKEIGVGYINKKNNGSDYQALRSLEFRK
jgi:hypothetical protein